MTFRYLINTLLICVCLAGSYAAAQSFEQGREAYINGEHERAYEILRPLADDGNSEAQKMLGIMYDYGHGVEKDKQEALEWYLKSAEQGQPAVQYQVGSKYFRGDGVEQDHTEAAKWWELASNGGQVDAQFNLGLMYFRGLSLEQDDRRAAELFRSAAEQGHGQAQYSLAVMYAFGRGLEQSYGKALGWFRKAAEQGVAQAQYNLGVFYENGHGVERDTDEAARWYERAAAQGLAQAEDRLAALDETSPAEPSPADSEQAGEPAAAADPEPVAGEDYDINEITPGGIRRGDWVLQQPADSYTLQIGSVTREQAIIDLIQDQGLETEAAYIKVVIDGVTRYNGLYGNYSTYEEAEQAAGRVTAETGIEPWIRNIGILQEMIQ